MKKILVLALCLLAITLKAQTTTDSITHPKFRIYVGLGVAVTSEFNINNNLKAVGLPVIGQESPEVTLGYNVAEDKVSMDFEVNANYFDRKNSENRVRSASAGAKLRLHYVPVRTASFFLSGGADLSYVTNAVEIYRRDIVTDLDNLDPADYNGRISLNNTILYAGPSIAAGFFQNRGCPVRLNVGYDFGLTNGKWNSDFGQIENNIKENGQTRFYAKVVLYL